MARLSPPLAARKQKKDVKITDTAQRVLTWNMVLRISARWLGFLLPLRLGSKKKDVKITDTAQRLLTWNIVHRISARWLGFLLPLQLGSKKRRLIRDSHTYK
jgi:hypothetical protein